MLNSKWRPKVMSGKMTGVLKSLTRHVVLAMVSAVLVVGTGEWSEDAEDLGKLLVLIHCFLFNIFIHNVVGDCLETVLRWTNSNYINLEQCVTEFGEASGNSFKPIKFDVFEETN